MAPGPQPLIAKPTAQRYRRGKLPPGAAPPPDSDDSSEEEDGAGVAQREDSKDVGADRLVAGGAGRVIQQDEVARLGRGNRGKAGIQVALRDVKVERGGEVYVGGKREVGRTAAEEAEAAAEASSSGEEESDEEPPSSAAQRPAPVFRKPGAAPPAEESEYETDSEEESESEEDEPEPPKPVYRPTFVPKRARETVQQREALAQEQEAIEAKRAEEAEVRKRESRALVGETIRREMAEREAPDLIPDVDDTDDLDPTAEFDAWRLRELSRLARDKEAVLAREAEREEIERRRALPAAQRDAEDEEYARRTREAARDERGERAFLEKYWHKGAFHQDEEILKRNYNVKLESTVDVSLLPKVMQVRNFGKMSRTKYTHLKDQDTTQDGWGTAARTGPGGMPGGSQQGCFNCGGPHLRRDCPNPPQQGTGPPGTGSNGAMLGGAAARLGGGREDERNRDQGYAGRARDDRDRLDYAGGRRDDYERAKGGYDRDAERAYGERDRRDERRYHDRRRSRSRSPRRADDRDRDRDRDGRRGDERDRRR